LDGIVVAHESIHSFKVSNKEGMLMKMDIYKAHDKMNWDFLKKILITFGFGGDWVD
jgi:hypothetical protein